MDLMRRVLGLIIHATQIVYAFPTASVDTGSVVLARFRQGFFDVPVALLSPDAELEVFFGDTVPILAGVSV